MATANNSAVSRLSREDFKKQQELEEMRKSGTAMPAVDEEGKMINPHIPQYISVTPWYYESSGPSLKHHTSKLHKDRQEAFDNLDASRTIKRSNNIGVKFRKGSCENCGAMSHKTKECLDKPRARTAKSRNITLGVDEEVTDAKVNFEGKRDRWANVDLSVYERVYEKHEKTAEARRQLKEQELERKLLQQRDKKEQGDTTGVTEADYDTDDDDDGTRQKDDDLNDNGSLIQSRDGKTKHTVRNLRIREDTAKYLRNLDVNSAYYDPKSRSMRENPYQPDDPRALLYSGDNALRLAGQVKDINQLQAFAWEAHEKSGADTHAMALPSAAAAQYQDFLQKKEQALLMKNTAIAAKYGSSATLGGGGSSTQKDYTDDDVTITRSTDTNTHTMKVLPKPILDNVVLESEAYAEYDDQGRVVKGQDIAVPKSKYMEDQLELNHSAIWGSYYDLQSHKWGYKCCQNLIRNSYCNNAERKRKRDDE